MGERRGRQARRVVLAIGVSHFSYVPAPFSQLPPELGSHTSRFDRLDGFAGQDITIIGAGQSAPRDRRAAPRARRHRAVPRPRQLDPVGRPPDPARPARSASGCGCLQPAWAPAGNRGSANTYRTRSAAYRRRSGCASRPSGSARPARGGCGRASRARCRCSSATSCDRCSPRRTASGSRSTALTDTRPTAQTMSSPPPATRSTSTVSPSSTPSSRCRWSSGRSPVLGKGFESSVPQLHFVGMASAASYGPVNRFVLGTRFTSHSVARATHR